MSKLKQQIPSVYSLSAYLKDDNLLPIYYLFGEDQFTIDTAAKTIEKTLSKKVQSDFDRETIDSEKNQKVGSLIDLAYSFPFGGGSKVIFVKNFERFSDRKKFSEYVNNPAEFTYLIITHSGKITDLGREPYTSLQSKNFLFEARKLKGEELIQWLMKSAKKYNLKISYETAKVMVEVIGDEKGLIEMQMAKLSDYLEDGAEIDPEHIKHSIASTKEYSIFDLQDAIGSGQKKKSIEVALNLLDSGQEFVMILGMITKFIATLAKSLELSRQNIDIAVASKEAGVSFYYYKNCLKSKYLMNEKRLIKSARAIYNADVMLKTSAADEKTIMTMMITEMLT